LDTSILLTNLRSYVDVSEEEFRAFLMLLVPLQLKKDEHFYRAGEVPRYSPFILKGCLRQYVVTDNGEEQIILFNEEGNWAGQVGSMRTKTPTNVYLQALEDCEILGITLDHIDLGMARFPWYQRYFLKKYPADHARLLEQANRLKTESPETLYRELLNERPSLILRLPQYHIANYLGVRTETLSRIKNKIAGR
jgi:CRP-like cAMP-binding protein